MIMDLNTIIFGSITVVSILIFLFLGKYKASESQRNRKDKINWIRRR